MKKQVPILLKNPQSQIENNKFHTRNKNVCALLSKDFFKSRFDNRTTTSYTLESNKNEQYIY